MTDFLSRMNGPQSESVTAGDGPVLVVAGAGSGKTRVLTTRIAWLMAEKKVHAGEILAFTFTNRAAKEMRERVAETVGQGQAPFWIGTFHATGLKILRTDGSHIGVQSSFSIFDTDDSKRLLKQVMKDLNIDPKQFTLNATRSVISKWKNEDIKPETARANAGSFIDEKYAELYEGYNAALVKCNALDFDDLILRTVHLLEQVDEVREKYARRFRHVMVDEFQDTNPLQLLLVKLLSSNHGNIFAVGDDDQSIYSWRGARIENMINFDDYFPGAATFRLEQNYRSTGNILNAANAVIAHNKQRKGKNLWTSGADGDLLTEEEFFDDEDEAARLTDIIRTEIAGGMTRGDVTILYRTNAQSRVLEDALRRAAIPYQIVGGLHFYDRKEVRDLMAYLKLVSNPADVIAAQRVINTPKRKIGNTTIGRLVSLAAAHELTLGEAAAQPGLLEMELAPAACKRVRKFFDMTTQWRRRVTEGQSVLDLLTAILSDTGYQGHLEAEDAETAGTRYENIAELLNAAASFQESSAGGTLDQFLEQVALVSDPDTIQDDEGVVRLMTIHTAKGLEFPVVVVAGVEDDILPHINSAEDEAGLEEERRLFYVAITRAEKRVYLLHAARRRRFGSWQESLPSRFLREVPDELVERRLLDSQSDFQEPIAQSLFGSAGGQASTWTGGSFARSQRQAGAGTPDKTTGNSSSRSVRPNQWGSRQEKANKVSDGWDQDVVQDGGQGPGYFEGQTVSHGIFGTGTVSRVEGSGDDMMVTVDFYDAGRKHINPRFAPLVPMS
ncbi:MAG: DNA helicase-2/ATP-dependent DNA helicase PcrA [Candidatus Krumholzibacteriia bacterium]